jgi:hypothetical protein
LLAGKPVFGEGLLVLDERFPSTLAYNTHGAFTEGLPEGNSLTAQINRIGYELLEEGLEELTVESMEVRLFDPEFPRTPIRIRVAGKSQTDRAIVPIVLDTNVNGSVAEVLDFVYRFLVL